MVYSSITLLTSPATAILPVFGVELNNSRRFVDLYNRTRCRVQFNSSGAISVRVEYSLDFGNTWTTLLSEGSYSGTNPYVSSWTTLPEEVQANDVLLRTLGIGSGVLLTVNYVEFSFD